MGCWACNPYCGNCKPPKERPRQCPSCQKYCFNPEAKDCPRCGAELPLRVPPPVVKCHYSGLICANPCNKHKIDVSAKWHYMPCKHNTPPQKEKE